MRTGIDFKGEGNRKFTSLIENILAPFDIPLNAVSTKDTPKRTRQIENNSSIGLTKEVIAV